MSTKIIGNQIDAATRAIIEALDVTEQINLPALNQTAINALGTPAYGTLVYNTTEDMHRSIFKMHKQVSLVGMMLVAVVLLLVKIQSFARMQTSSIKISLLVQVLMVVKSFVMDSLLVL